AMRDTVKGDIAMDNETFYGTPIMPGPITREQIFGLYPRIFDFTQPLGWTVWRIRVQGWGLSFLINTALQGGHVAHVLGLDYDLVSDGNGNLGAANLSIDGRPVKPFKTYTVA